MRIQKPIAFQMFDQPNPRPIQTPELLSKLVAKPANKTKYSFYLPVSINNSPIQFYLTATHRFYRVDTVTETLVIQTEFPLTRPSTMTAAPKKMFEFRKDASPTDEEFRQIGIALANAFQDLNLGPCETLKLHVEKGSWVYVQLIVGDRKWFRGDAFLAVLTCSFLNSMPTATSVVLKFQDGKRVTNGRDSILTSSFSESGWTSLAWEHDGFGEWEWECNHMDELVALKQ